MPSVNPVLIKELRSRMRGARAFILLTGYLLILSAFTLLLYVAIVPSLRPSMNAGRQIGMALFLTIATVALIQVCLITPLLTAGSIAGEKERQTYDLLVASLLSPWQIVWGKLAAALAFALLIVFASVPLMSLAFLFGGVSLAEVVIALIGLVATSVLYATIGLYWSTVMRSTLAASSLAIGTVILMLIGVPFLTFVVMMILEYQIDSWSDWAPFIYALIVFLSSHPFIALGLTEAQIKDNQGIFFFNTNGMFNSHIVVLSPWIVYVGLALALAALLVLLSVRRLRPGQYGP